MAALRRDMGAGPDDFVIGAVGRLHRVKGFDLLIQAFAQARPQRAWLVIVGDGEERARLEALCGERVVFLGYQTRAKDYYQAFDLLAVSSRDEPFSLTILEAMDADLPNVATAAEGPKQILTGQPAELVPLDDVEALAAALRRAAEARPGRVRYDLSRFPWRRGRARSRRFTNDWPQALRGKGAPHGNPQFRDSVVDRTGYCGKIFLFDRNGYAA